MRLNIITPERTLVDQDVDAVYAVSIDGSIGILANHIPMVTPLEIGLLSYAEKGQKTYLAVMGGILSTDGKTVSVLCEAAELKSEIDVTRAQKAKERAEAALKQKQDDAKEEAAKLALARAITRIKTAQR